MLQPQKKFLHLMRTMHLIGRNLHRRSGLLAAGVFIARIQDGQQLGRSYIQRSGDLHEVFEAQIFFAALDLADVGSVEIADIGELLL